MNTKTLMQYDNRKKNKTTAYLLGALSWIIPLGLHKWYLGHTDWAVVYVLLALTSILTVGTIASFIFSMAYTIFLLIDVIKTSMDVDKHNNNLIEELGGLDE